MVEYGTAKHSGDDVDNEPTSPDGAEESSALLSTPGTAPRRNIKDGHATIVSCVSNLCNTIIGSGALSLRRSRKRTQ